MNHTEKTSNSAYDDKVPRGENDSYGDVFVLTEMEFPKEFRKSFVERFDKNYLSVLAVSIVLHVAIAIYFIINPISKEGTIRSIAKIQQRMAKKVLEKEVHLKEPIAQLELLKKKPEEEKEVLKAEGAAKTGGARPSSRESSPAEGAKKEGPNVARRGRGSGRPRGKSREEIAAAVSSKGILALLTSSSGSASGEGVEDILGQTGESGQDLDQALSKLSGIKTGGAPGRRKGGAGHGDGGVKGARTAAGGGGIDDLLTGLGTTKSNSFSRSGDLVVVNESPLIEGGSEKGIVGRNQDDIQGVIMKHNNSMQYCYERQLKRNPNLKGKMVLRITITPQGTVKKVEIISSTLKNRKVEQCVVSRIRRWSDFGVIKQSYGDTTIRQTYAFGY
ncbi:MAG: TonB family protein [bacterium]